MEAVAGVIDGHDDDGQAAQHVDGRQAITARVNGNSIQGASPIIWQDIDMKTVIYGIPNCDTMKKARAWLESRGVAHEFHDYKKAGIERAKLEGWVEAVGWEVLLNRAG